MNGASNERDPRACSVLVEKLRDEIVVSQQGRYELAKWKLILSAALGGAALGLTGNEGELALLLLVPLVCLYVDLLCHHGNFRILIIGKFLRESQEVCAEVRNYERYCQAMRQHFRLEGWVLLGTSIIFSACVILAGLLLPGHTSKVPVVALRWSLVLAGVLGILAASVLQWWASSRVKRMNTQVSSDSHATDGTRPT